MTTPEDDDPYPLADRLLTDTITTALFQNLKEEIDKHGLNGTVFARAIQNKFLCEFHKETATIEGMDVWLWNLRAKVYKERSSVLRELLGRWADDEDLANCSEAETAALDKIRYE